MTSHTANSPAAAPATSARPVFDHSSACWSSPEPAFFHHLRLTPRVQVGGSCVPTGLSLLTREEPLEVRAHVNTQDPVSWSRYLQRHGMKLAYCSTDLRRLRYYVDELLAHDDLFTVSIYSPSNANQIGLPPDESGWICGSHFLLVHRDMVYDTQFDTPIPLSKYEYLDRYVKRMFRVVPADHPRGL